MTKRSSVTMGLFMGIVCLAGAVDAQVESGSYRVDMEYVQDGERMTMRRYIDGPRSRMETVFDGETYITIELGDAAGTTYVLMPEEKQAMKMTVAGTRVAIPASPDITPSAASTGSAGDPPMELVGTETIDGKAARKYRVKGEGGDGFVWLEVDREVPLRMESGGVTVDMKNYDFAPLPGALFEVPRGYEVIDIDAMMRQSASASVATMALRGAVGAAGTQAGGAAGSHFGAMAGASIGGALGGPIGAMIGQFLGQSFGKKAGQKAGAAAVGVIP